jgi:hypothetical protein
LLGRLLEFETFAHSDTCRQLPGSGSSLWTLARWHRGRRCRARVNNANNTVINLAFISISFDPVTDHPSSSKRRAFRRLQSQGPCPSSCSALRCEAGESSRTRRTPGLQRRACDHDDASGTPTVRRTDERPSAETLTSRPGIAVRLNPRRSASRDVAAAALTMMALSARGCDQVLAQAKGTKRP